MDVWAYELFKLVGREIWQFRAEWNLLPGIERAALDSRRLVWQPPLLDGEFIHWRAETPDGHVLELVAFAQCEGCSRPRHLTRESSATCSNCGSEGLQVTEIRLGASHHDDPIAAEVVEAMTAAGAVLHLHSRFD